MAVGAIAIAACSTGDATPTTGPGQQPTATVEATPTTRPVQRTPTPTPRLTSTPSAEPLSVSQLKYAVLDAYPDFFWCDPDFYPIAREDEQVLALERFDSIQADAEEFAVILERLKLSADTFTDADKLAIYQQHKKIGAIPFEEWTNGYTFTIRTSDNRSSGRTVSGDVNMNGVINVKEITDAFVTCPICLARGVMISTPNGDVAVQDLLPGNTVWTVDSLGKRHAQPLVKISAVASVPGQVVTRVLLADGRALLVSPGHPDADGRALGTLMAGDVLDGAGVVSAESVLYAGGATFDILPAGDTGAYWANGILIGSTLAQ